MEAETPQQPHVDNPRPAPSPPGSFSSQKSNRHHRALDALDRPATETHLPITAATTHQSITRTPRKKQNPIAAAIATGAAADRSSNQSQQDKQGTSSSTTAPAEESAGIVTRSRRKNSQSSTEADKETAAVPSSSSKSKLKRPRESQEPPKTSKNKGKAKLEELTPVKRKRTNSTSTPSPPATLEHTTRVTRSTTKHSPAVTTSPKRKFSSPSSDLTTASSASSTPLRKRLRSSLTTPTKASASTSATLSKRGRSSPKKNKGKKVTMEMMQDDDGDVLLKAAEVVEKEEAGPARTKTKGKNKGKGRDELVAEASSSATSASTSKTRSSVVASNPFDGGVIASEKEAIVLEVAAVGNNRDEDRDEDEADVMDEDLPDAKVNKESASGELDKAKGDSTTSEVTAPTPVEGDAGEANPDDPHDDDEDLDDDEDHDDEDEDDLDGDDGGADAGGASGSLAGARGSGGAGGVPGGIFGAMRGIGGIMSGLSGRLKSILANLRAKEDPSLQLIALQDLAELLSVSTEDTLAGYFSCDTFVKELVVLMRGDDLEDNPDMMLLACRCVSNLVEAMPSAMGSVVYNGCVPVLCQKLLEIQYIDLAEQALSTLQKISVEYPTAIVKEGGLGAVLEFLDFFSTHVQRVAVTTAANCCKNVPADCFPMAKAVVPTLNRLVTYSDQKVVEQTCLCFVRLADSFKWNKENLEQIVDRDLLKTVKGLVSPTNANAISPHIYTHLLRFLSTISRSSPNLGFELLDLGIVDTLYTILTGVSPPSPDEMGSAGHTSAAVVANVVHRPKDQVFEILGVITELLPALPKDGIFSMALEEPKKKVVEEALADPTVELTAFAVGPSDLVEAVEAGVPTAEQTSSATEPSTSAAEVVISATESATSAMELDESIAEPAASGEDATSEPVASRTRSADKRPEVEAASVGESVLATEAMPAADESTLITENTSANEKQKEAEAEDARIEMLNAHPEIVRRIGQLLIPTLIEVFSATVNLHVRQRVATALLKIVYFSDPKILESVLKDVPLSSFLAGVLSQQEHSSLVISALQVCELLIIKLPDDYHFHFRREGVMYEINKLADTLDPPPVSPESSKGSSSSASRLNMEVPPPSGTGSFGSVGRKLNDLVEDLRKLRDQGVTEADGLVDVGSTVAAQEAEAIETTTEEPATEVITPEPMEISNNVAAEGEQRVEETVEAIETAKIAEAETEAQAEQEGEQATDMMADEKGKARQEGVMETDNNASSSSAKPEEPTKIEPKTSKPDSSSSTNTATSTANGGIPSALSSGMRILERLGIATSSRNSALSRSSDKGIGSGDTRVWILQRARRFRDTYFKDGLDESVDDGEANAGWAPEDVATAVASHPATLVLKDLKNLTTALKGSKTDPTSNEALVKLAGHFKNTGNGISSFELLNSGLMEGLLNYLTDTDWNEFSSLNDRHRTFLQVFMGGPDPATLKLSTTNQQGDGDAMALDDECPPKHVHHVIRGSSTAFQVLVKRLQESLSRLEPFEVVTAYQNPLDDGRKNAATMLAKQLRLKLTAEEGTDVHRNYTNLVVSIHAIATFKALEEYLRPRIGTAAGSSSSLPTSGRSVASSRASRLASAFKEFAAVAGIEIGEPETVTPADDNGGVGSSTAVPASTGEDGDVSKESGGSSTRKSNRLSAKSVESTVDDEIARPAEQATEEPVTAAAPDDEEDHDHADDMNEDIDVEAEEEYDDDESVSDEMFDGELSSVRRRSVTDDPMATPGSERTIDMTVTEDGSGVEARTLLTTQPGTSIPLGVTASSSASSLRTSPAPSFGSSTKDWHVQFSIGDIPVSADVTIYSAVHQYETRLGGGNRNVWSSIYPITFKKVLGPQSSSSNSTDAASGAGASQDNWFSREMPASVASDKHYSKILNLLRALHSLNARWADIYGEDYDGADGNAVVAPLPKADFANSKLTAKMNRQLEEPLIVASSCLPSWAHDLARSFPFLFPFETRYLYLQSTSFGYSRLMTRWQNQQSRNAQDNRRDDSQPFLGRIQRQKVRISRSRMLESAVKVLELYGQNQSVLEVEYFEEVGTGLGPTLEFYSTISKEFCKKSIKMWRDDGSNGKSEFVATTFGLFPKPLGDVQVESENGKKIMNLFKVLGQFVGKALLDSRIIDIPFNTLFIEKVLGNDKAASLALIKGIDPSLWKSLNDLQYFIRQKKLIYANTVLTLKEREQLLSVIELRGAKVDDMYLDFTLPGYSDIELRPGGSEIPVTIHNLDEYVQSVIDYTIGHGIARQVEAFRAGFGTVFAVNDLKSFSSDELVALFGTANEDWTYDTLIDAIKADHGYTMDSRSIQHLIQLISQFSDEERREFLQFITGSPKLPIGGWKNLNPLFTVVRKPFEAPLSADDYLPSVMTCVNYLKMPDYSSKSIMKQKLLIAMREGQGSFHLS